MVLISVLRGEIQQSNQGKLLRVYGIQVAVTTEEQRSRDQCKKPRRTYEKIMSKEIT